MLHKDLLCTNTAAVYPMIKLVAHPWINVGHRFSREIYRYPSLGVCSFSKVRRLFGLARIWTRPARPERLCSTPRRTSPAGVCVCAVNSSSHVNMRPVVHEAPSSPRTGADTSVSTEPTLPAPFKQQTMNVSSYDTHLVCDESIYQ